MPDEPPKYTIADNYDPGGNISAYADPGYEHMTYLRRVMDGEVVDMGFKRGDFNRHVSELAEKRSKESFMLAAFIDAVCDALTHKNWYAALALALTLPDICGDLEKPKRGVGERYVQWWNSFVLFRYKGLLSSEDCYALRCSFLHQGLSDITKQTKRKVRTNFRFVHPDPRVPIPPHLNLIRAPGHEVLQLQVDVFCEDICAGVEQWERKKLSKDPEIKKRASEMLRILPPQMFASSIQ